MQGEETVRRMVEHLFRHEAGRMLATLTNIFGLKNFDLAEEVVQEALLQALRQWPFQGVPDNPRAWIVRAARNKAVELLRRRSSLHRKLRELVERFEERQARLEVLNGPDASELHDEQLAMMFLCCDPALPPDARVALTLKAVSGFSVSEIARAFLAEEATIAQRLVRAKRRLRELGIELALPSTTQFPDRLDSVLQVLYLVFNEGYSARSGAELVREDLCGEAIRLAELLASRRDTGVATVHALLALFYLQAARLPARVDGAGELSVLAEQDRRQWDQTLLSRGVALLDHAAQGDVLSEYHLQAAIAAIHATSPSFDETAWPRLLDLYDELLAVAPSPVVALNRAIAESMVDGPESALDALDDLESDPRMKTYYLLPAARADLLRRLGKTAEAAAQYLMALDYPCTDPERRFLLRRLESVASSDSIDPSLV
jgi:RNA polymerase sigma-70 factor (ECF subfamily)